MKRKRYTEEQILSSLKGHEAGASVPDLSRRHGAIDEHRVSRRLQDIEVRSIQDSGPDPIMQRSSTCFSLYRDALHSHSEMASAAQVSGLVYQEV